MKHVQYIIVEFNNCPPFVYKMQSSKKITIESVVEYFERTEGFNEDRDSITFIDNPSPLNMDIQ